MQLAYYDIPTLESRPPSRPQKLPLPLAQPKRTKCTSQFNECVEWLISDIFHEMSGPAKIKWPCKNDYFKYLLETHGNYSCHVFFTSDRVPGIGTESHVFRHKIRKYIFYIEKKFICCLFLRVEKYANQFLPAVIKIVT